MITDAEYHPVLLNIPFITFISIALFALSLVLLLVIVRLTGRKKKLDRDFLLSSYSSQLINSIPDAVCFKDQHGKYISANKTFLGSAGVSALSDIVGKTVLEVFPQKYAVSYQEDEKLILSGENEILVKNETGLDPEGYEIPLLSYKIALKNESGITIGIAEIARDVTHWKQLERDMLMITEDLNDSNRQLTQRQEEIEKLNATKDRLLSIIAHDLKNPFNSIIGLSDILLLRFATFKTKDIEELIGMINIASKSAYGLLENLLDWGRSQTETIVFSPKNVPVKELIQEIITLLTLQANKKEISLKDSIPDGASILADRNMLHTVIRNIAGNAVKYTDTGGMVHFSYQKTENHSVLSISDTGVGIPEDKIKSMFKLDQIESTTGTSGESGTGLGLIVCAEFMQKHRGDIQVESKTGEGTVFHLRFPL